MDIMSGTDVEQCTKETISKISAKAISTFILEKIVLDAIEKFGEKDFVNREHLSKFIAVYLKEHFVTD